MIGIVTGMFGVIFTLDYEIHGNGDGSPHGLMVEPTSRLLALFERYGARLTIMADIAEILKFKEYRDEFGRDDYQYEAVTEQLRGAVRCGHDVQLHIHSSYFNARYDRGRWVQDWSEYDFAGLGLERLREVIRAGKEFLESLLQPVDPRYKCNVFRAANWSVSPSINVVRALVENGIKIDTSVFKYGRRRGLVNFDYSGAFSQLVPWKVDGNDICAASEAGRLVEFPIYSENRWLGAFLTPQRLHRAYETWRHKFANGSEGGAAEVARPKPEQNGGGSRRLARRYAWKADFNQCSGRQLIRALKRAETQHRSPTRRLPFVLIGHSKLFTRFNDWSLRPFLGFVADHPGRFCFAKFSDFEDVKVYETKAGGGMAPLLECDK
jgi:hypothetical protein